MKRLTRPEVKALARFHPGDAVTCHDEDGIIGCTYSKQGGIWYSVVFPRYGKSGRYYDAIEQIEESKIQRRLAKA